MTSKSCETKSAAIFMEGERNPRLAGLIGGDLNKPQLGRCRAKGTRPPTRLVQGIKERVPLLPEHHFFLKCEPRHMPCTSRPAVNVVVTFRVPRHIISVPS